MKEGIKGELYSYQKVGIEFLMNSNGRALLADEPGTGKTVQSLAYTIKKGYKRTLVICPASVKFSWESEIEKWTYLKSFVVDARTDLSLIPPEINYIIINYDVLRKHYNELAKYRFDCMILDESHYIKSSTAIRTKVVKALAKSIPSVIMLTGTPVLSRPIEIFNTLNIIDGKTWNSWYRFAVKYCGGKRNLYGFEALGATNISELRKRIDKYFLRRKKSEVLSELPPKVRTEIPIELPAESRKAYNLVEKSLIAYLKVYEKTKTDKEIAKTMRGEKLVKLNILRQINTMGKIPVAKELIQNIIDSGEKVLVFSSFNAPLKELEEDFQEHSVLLLGETPVEERGEIIKKFQENPKTQVFFGGILSSGIGITLTKASNIVFLDLPWRPSDLEQAESRPHRPGAEYSSLNIYTITSRNTIDSFLKKLLSKKQEIIDQLIEGDEEKTHESMIDEYLRELQLKYKK